MDSIVNKVIDKLKTRSARGISKYGTTLDRQDLSIKDWLNHLQEELLDAANYAEVLLNNPIIKACSEFRASMAIAGERYHGKDLESEQARLAVLLLQELDRWQKSI